MNHSSLNQYHSEIEYKIERKYQLAIIEKVAGEV